MNDELCVWCRQPEDAHAAPAPVISYLANPPLGRLCPVPGVTSQYYTPPFEQPDTPITEKWLRSVGFKHKHYQRQDVFAISFKCPIGDPQWIETTELPGAFLLCRMSPMYDDDTPPDRISVSAPTRGAMRRLCAALGITIAEKGT